MLFGGLNKVKPVKSSAMKSTLWVLSLLSVLLQAWRSVPQHAFLLESVPEARISIQTVHVGISPRKWGVQNETRKGIKAAKPKKKFYISCHWKIYLLIIPLWVKDAGVFVSTNLNLLLVQQCSWGLNVPCPLLLSWAGLVCPSREHPQEERMGEGYSLWSPLE